MKKEVDYLSLAKKAVEKGNFKLYRIYRKNHARVMLKMQKTPASNGSQG